MLQNRLWQQNGYSASCGQGAHGQGVLAISRSDIPVCLFLPRPSILDGGTLLADGTFDGFCAEAAYNSSRCKESNPG